VGQAVPLSASPEPGKSKHTAQSGHMSSHRPQDVQTSGRARKGVPFSRTTIASVGQKWLQMPHCLQRCSVNIGSFFLVRSLAVTGVIVY
jgi:hypothetical protein